MEKKTFLSHDRGAAQRETGVVGNEGISH